MLLAGLGSGGRRGARGMRTFCPWPPTRLPTGHPHWSRPVPETRFRWNALPCHSVLDETKPFRFMQVNEEQTRRCHRRPRPPHTRPRVEGVREAEILEAALEVLAEVGYDRFTMDAVALRAKASKATLYRRWNGKVQLVIDALHHDHQQHHYTEQGPVDTGSLRGDLIAAFCGDGGLTDKPEVDTFGAILTAITRDAEFAEAFRTRGARPQAGRRPRRSSSAPRSAARSARTSTSSCSRRPWPGSCCTASSSSAKPPPRSSSSTSSTRSSFLPRPRPADRHPSHPQRDHP